MGYYVVMVSEQEFTRLQETQTAIDRMPDVPERPDAAYHDAWASCLACGDRCEYGEAVELKDSTATHTHGIVHPDCAGE